MVSGYKNNSHKKMLWMILVWMMPNILKAQAQLPSVTNGRIVRMQDFHTPYVTDRPIDVWLPEGYSDAEKYDVLYMHDGQMLFDSTITWNKKSWHMDEVAASMQQSGQLKKFIIVGIWNDPATRHADYFPQKPYKKLSRIQQAYVTASLKEAGRINDTFVPNSDNYLKYIVHEIKPLIDARFSVHTDRQHTFMAGSSMGGLVSCYAICEYPNIFGGVACLSTHWPGVFTLKANPLPEAFLAYVNDHLPDPVLHKIYFDCGDQTLDTMYPAIQQRMDKLLAKKGYTTANSQSRYYKDAPHDEQAWARRIHEPLLFLLKQKK